MPAVWYKEIYDSPKWGEDNEGRETISRVYHVYNTGDPSIAGLYGPQRGELWDPAKPNLKVISKDARRTDHPTTCRLEVVYREVTYQMEGADLFVGRQTWTLNLMSATQHIDSIDSPANRTRFPESDSESVAIGIDPETRDIQGADIYAPGAGLTVTCILSSSQKTSAYYNAVLAMEAMVNSDQFGMFEPGTVLFLGATFRDITSQFREGTYEFLVRAKRTLSKQVRYRDSGGVLRTVTFYYVGMTWEQVWYEWQAGTQGNNGEANELAGWVSAVNIDKVYTETAFAALGLRFYGGTKGWTKL